MDDDLTGVTNRRALMERLESELRTATRHGDVFAVALCDVDGLKRVKHVVTEVPREDNDVSQDEAVDSAVERCLQV